MKIVNNIREVFTNMHVYPDVEKIKNDENHFSTGALDSLVLIQFVLALEEEFKIRLKNEDINYEKFQSFNSIEETVKQYINTRKTS